MTEQATVGIVLRGDPGTISAWVHDHPAALEIVKVVHDSTGVSVLSTTELVAIREEYIDHVHGRTRRVLKEYNSNHRTSKEGIRE